MSVGAPELIVLVLVVGAAIFFVRRTMQRGAARGPQLMRCPACEAKVSSRATKCPHCGDPL